MQHSEVAVLVSIRPEYVAAIIDGRKTVELRRRFPASTPGTRLLVYATKPIGGLVGYAPIKRVLFTSPSEIWRRYHRHLAISRQEFDLYFRGCSAGHAVVLGDFVRIKKIDAQSLGQSIPGFRPPQSFRYVRPEQLRHLL